MFKAESYEGAKLCFPGDLVINTMWAWMSALGVSKYEGIISSSYHVYRLRKGNQLEFDYIDKLLRTWGYNAEYRIRSTGIRPSRLRLYPDKFLTIPIIIPSLEEQRQIIKYIKFKSFQISRLIRAKKRIIELLKEQKQAIINQAVTRGLDPDVKLKPSGVEWLGKIPEHWEVVPLRWNISISSGDFRSGDLIKTEVTSKYTYPVIGGNGVLGYTNEVNTNNGTIIIGRVGALCGNVHYITEPAWITDNALRISEIINFNNEFLAIQLSAMNLNRLSKANAQPLVTGGMIKKQRVVLPSINEQNNIITFIKEKETTFNRTISSIEREISLMQEYRIRLIADVVTGKVDVRDIEVPDVVDEELAIENPDETENIGEATVDAGGEDDDT
jgi:type I restriction enzyme S subunit